MLLFVKTPSTIDPERTVEKEKVKTSFDICHQECAQLHIKKLEDDMKILTFCLVVFGKFLSTHFTPNTRHSKNSLRSDQSLNREMRKLTAKRSAGVASEVNLRSPLPTGFETQGRRHQKSKTAVQWPHEKDLCPPNLFL